MSLTQELEQISVAEIKAKLSEKLNNVEERGRRYLITAHGKPRGILMSYKEYLSLVDNDAAPPKRISLSEWKRGAEERSKIIDSVSAVFDTSKLSRKGQKGYKKDAVKKSDKS